GNTVCANAVSLPMLDTDAAVLQTLESSVLNPEIVERMILLAIADLDVPSEPGPAPTDLRAQLADLDHQLARLTHAIAAGGVAVPPLVRRMQELQRRRDAVSALLAPAPARPRLDRTALRREVEERLADWQGALRRNRPQGRQLLRKLLVGRLRFTPGPEGV